MKNKNFAAAHHISAHDFASHCNVYGDQQSNDASKCHNNSQFDTLLNKIERMLCSDHLNSN